MDQTIVKPKVSVVMSFYNCELYILDAIQSILNQTFGDFELICIDDASTDRSAIILESIKDPRIIIIYNDKNMGVAKSVNRGVAIAQGELIARMDADDISMPDRFSKQVAFLDEHPNIDVVVSQIEQIDSYGNKAGKWKEDREADLPEKIRQMMPSVNCIAQPSSMIRKQLLVKYPYNSKFNVEDWALWLTILSEGKVIYKINEPLLKYRIHNKSITVSNRKRSVSRIISFQWTYLWQKISQFNFKNYDFFVAISFIKNIALYPWRVGIRPFLSICRKIVRANPIGLLFDLLKLKKIINELPDSTSHFFFFPFYHVGGAEKVHISILESISDCKPIVFFTKVSVNKSFFSLFEQQAQCIDVGRLCSFPVFEKLTRQLISNRINKCKTAFTFGCNSYFYYRMLKLVKESVKCIDLVHAFVHPSEEGPEYWSLPVVEKLSNRVFISRFAMEQMKELYHKHNHRQELIDRFVFIKNYTELSEHFTIYDPTIHSLNVLYIGRGTAEKRVELVGKIATKVNGMKFRISFTLIGNNEWAVQQEDRNSCKFTGEIQDQNQINKLLLDSQILLITSSREGMPMVIMEAMSHAVVPISTQVGDISEYIHNGQNGFIIDSKNSETIISEMSSLIIRLYHNPDELNQMRKRTLEDAGNFFNKIDFITAYRRLLL